MSCRSTKGGTVAHRLARAYSGLNDRTVQSLFHALKREGAGLPAPSAEDYEAWRLRTNTLIKESGMSAAQIERSEHDLFLTREEMPDGATFYSWSTIEARARQEAALRSVKGMVADLEPAGSQADEYMLGPDGRPKYVWYASYGSNLSKDRFMTYITGGTPEGTYVNHEGARDKELLDEDCIIPIRYQGRMHFAGASGRWEHGGVAFMDVDNSGHALGRAYLVTMEQFDDIVAQENGKKPGELTVETAEALKEGKSKVTPGLYGTLEHIGDYQSTPVLTFTGNFAAHEALAASVDKKYSSTKTNTPSDNYIRMIGSGLGETFGMAPEEQADYLRGSLGAHNISRDRMIEVLTTPPDIVEPPKPKKTYKSLGMYRGDYYSPTSYGDLGRGDSGARSSRRKGGLGPAYSRSRWDDEWDSYRGSDGSWADTYFGEPSGRDYSRADEEEFNLNQGLNWWDFNSEKEYEDYLADVKKNGGKTALWEWEDGPEAYPEYRKRCAFCGEHGHKMHDCPHV